MAMHWLQDTIQYNTSVSDTVLSHHEGIVPRRVAHSRERQESCGHEPLHVGGIAARRIVVDSRPSAAGVGRETEEAPEEGLRRSPEDLLLMGGVQERRPLRPSSTPSMCPPVRTTGVGRNERSRSPLF